MATMNSKHNKTYLFILERASGKDDGLMSLVSYFMYTGIWTSRFLLQFLGNHDWRKKSSSRKPEISWTHKIMPKRRSLILECSCSKVDSWWVHIKMVFFVAILESLLPPVYEWLMVVALTQPLLFLLMCCIFLLLQILGNHDWRKVHLYGFFFSGAFPDAHDIWPPKGVPRYLAGWPNWMADCEIILLHFVLQFLLQNEQNTFRKGYPLWWPTSPLTWPRTPPNK